MLRQATTSLLLRRTGRFPVCVVQLRRPFSSFAPRSTDPLTSPKPWTKEVQAMGWQLQRSVPVPEFDLTAYELLHTRTGAKYVHVDREDSDNLFCVTFRTPPQSSNGVAHILEHSVLCGSEKYPVRDPFFYMLKRSLKTFMNAMTAQEYTMYPFSTQNEQDFQNLLQVYLDAAFFPRLEELDFRQEGHRLEFETMTDSTTPLMFKGIVFNEMKGAMSDIHSHFSDVLSHYLFKEAPYHYNSGGDPKHIPSLTHPQLKAFHAQHYHPSNACFFSYGDMIPLQWIRTISNDVLPRFQPLPAPVKVGQFEKRWTQGRREHATCPPDPMVPDQDRQHIVSITYLCNTSHSADPLETFALQFMASLLVDGSQSPMYTALIDPNIGSDFSPCTGYDSSMQEACFSIGLMGTREQDADLVLKIVNQTFVHLSEVGFEQENIDGLLHQIELGIKHVKVRYGMGLMSSMMPYWRDNADIFCPLHVEQLLTSFKQALADGPFLQNLIKKWLLPENNPHHLILTMGPDNQFNAKLAAAEADKLKQLRAELDPAAVEQVVAQALQLKERQSQAPNPGLLPTLRLSDVQKEGENTILEERAVGAEGNQVPLFVALQPTNGVTYLKGIRSLDSLPAHLFPYLPLFCSFLTSMGAAGRDHKQLSKDMNMHTGGIYTNVAAQTDFYDTTVCLRQIGLRTSALDRNLLPLLQLVRDCLTEPHFYDLQRLKTLLASHAQDLSASLQDDGHKFAKLDSASRIMSVPAMAAAEQWQGITQVRFVNALVAMDPSQQTAGADAVAEEKEEEEEGEEEGGDSATVPAVSTAKLQALSQHLLEILQWLTAGQDGWLMDKFMVSGQHAGIETVQSSLSTLHRPGTSSSSSSSASSSFSSSSSSSSSSSDTPAVVAQKQFFALPINVNHVALCLPTVPFVHQDTAALTVAAQLMSSLFLHTAIREKGGAYGGGCNHDAATGVFSFMSYRDPGCLQTLQAFHDSVAWCAAAKYEDRDIEEALMSVFGALDAPTAPASKGTSEFFAGLTNEQRQKRREALLAVTRADITRAVTTHLNADAMARAPVSVVGNAEAIPDAIKNDPAWAVVQL